MPAVRRGGCRRRGARASRGRSRALPEFLAGADRGPRQDLEAGLVRVAHDVGDRAGAEQVVAAGMVGDDAGADAAGGRDEAELAQPAQGLADRGTADAETLAELGLRREHVANGQPAREDLGREGGGDGRIARLEIAGQAGRGVCFALHGMLAVGRGALPILPASRRTRSPRPG